MIVKKMAGGEVENSKTRGWLPVNNPSLVLVDKPPISTPVTEGLDFPYLEAQQEEINRDWVSRPLNPWQQSNLILDRQQEGGFPLPLQLSPPVIAVGGILLSLFVTAVIGQIYVCFAKSFLLKLHIRRKQTITVMELTYF